MRLSKITSIPDNESLIVTGKSENDFLKYLPGRVEKKYLKDQLSKDKNTITINLFDRLIIFSLIEDKDPADSPDSIEEMRKAGHKIFNELISQNIKSVTLVNESGNHLYSVALVEGLALSNYQFLKYFSDVSKKRNSLKEIKIYCKNIDIKSITELKVLIDAVYKVRDLINEPLSYLTAVKFAEEIVKMGNDAGFSVEVLNKKRIESLKMGGLLAVNKGSVNPPVFCILEYKPSSFKNLKPVVFVGKGIVFDTGGLSLKPTLDSMDYMKCDMSGAAAVAGLFYSVAKNNLPLHIIGLIPATDNRPDGNAYVPGDVVTIHGGTTVEVLNTDAEGRLIIADALAYAKIFDPELVIDIATLTGSAQITFGNLAMAGMGNANSDIMDLLVNTGYQVNERVAMLPFWNGYNEMLKSDIADLKNIGGKVAGAITAGKFLENFTDYPFIHLDIAGVAFNKKCDSYRGKGASGVGVRLLYQFLKNKYCS